MTDTLPRMDVAVFVGFAACGPLHLPVAVEDAEHFAAIFGGDAPLAWNQQRGERLYAYLAPAVRAFFRNGGRRCWVVRVAGAARLNLFPLSGVVRRVAADRLAPAFASARSAGSWSDGLRLGAALLSQPLEVAALALDTLQLELPPALVGRVEVGGLLRLTFRRAGYVLMLPAAVVTTIAPDDPARQPAVVVGGAEPTWFKTAPLSDSLTNPAPALARVLLPEGEGPPLAVSAWSFTELGEVATLLIQVPIGDAPVPGTRVRLDVGPTQVLMTVQAVLATPAAGTVELRGRELGWSLPAPDQVLLFSRDDEPISARALGRLELSDGDVTLDLDLPALALPLGTMLRVDVAGEQLWLTVQHVRVIADVGATGEHVQVRGQGLWLQATRPLALPTALRGQVQLAAERLTCELLSLELWARQDQAEPLRLDSLAFGPDHPRFWGALPSDNELYDATVVEPRQRHESLWRDAAEPRFPLAGNVAGGLCLPIALAPLPEQFMAPVEQPGTPLERDGLALFDARLFLDPQLIDGRTDGLIARADFLRYQSVAARPLTGIHAALSLEEATIIAVPDAVHPGWIERLPDVPLPPQESLPLARPAWWSFLDCDPAPAIPAVREPPWGNFLSCDTRVIAPPELELLAGPGASGTFTLSWSLPGEQGASF
ncbi:MAG: hypothetical protein H7Y32_09880, partial [Chloroflexales bacterium]|nr:hypothetical protein [Chloroflexales bacterium]